MKIRRFQKFLNQAAEIEPEDKGLIRLQFLDTSDFAIKIVSKVRLVCVCELNSIRKQLTDFVLCVRNQTRNSQGSARIEHRETEGKANLRPDVQVLTLYHTMRS